MYGISRGFVGGLIGSLVLVSSAAAQEWATKMFPETTYNFGVVARDAKTEHRFEFTNLYRDDIHIAGVRASCGCTTPIVTPDTVKSLEKGAIVAHFNTDRFDGQHGATLTVVIDRPQPAEVQLRVDGYIRTDVVVNPGQVELGSVDQGTAKKQTLTIDYAGRADWQITEVRSPYPYLKATAKEVSRQGDHIQYQVDVELTAAAPAGWLANQLAFITNDSAAPWFPLTVEGRVVPELSVAPSSLLLGMVHSGQHVGKQLVVQAKRPFHVLGVQCDDPAFKFTQPADAKSVQLIPVTFVAGDALGKVKRKITIRTDLGEDVTVEVTAFAEVTALANQ